MDVKEKLVELLNEAFFDYNHGKGDGYIPKNFADHLIANGVTVQEWISVAEPPKEYRDGHGELIPFLVCAEGTDYPFRAMYDGKTWGDEIFEINVKWWMPIPLKPEVKND